MPSISGKRLHTRSYLERVLPTAGQFAHLNDRDFSRILEELYDIDHRLDRIIRDGEDPIAEAAVPMFFVKAGAGDLLKERAYDAAIINYVAEVYGVLCCLCLRVDRRSNLNIAHHNRFVQYICPSTLRIDGGGLRNESAPICQICRESIGRHLAKHRVAMGLTYYDTSLDNPDIWNDALAWLMANSGFRARVRENRGREASLRFDPRQILRQPAARQRQLTFACKRA